MAPIQSLLSFLLLGYASAQLSGSVGPLTTISEKKSVALCNVLDYGAVADNSTDLGPALTDAFKACIDGELVYIPSGNYLLKTWSLYPAAPPGPYNSMGSYTEVELRVGT